jgi:hypothetical protein
MKKKVITLALPCIVLIAVMLFMIYRNFGLKQANKYARYFVEVTHRPTFKREAVITQDVKVEKIIRQTPIEIVFMIKWGNNEKAYVTVENWMTKAHDTIELHVVDKGKLIVIYE